MTVMDLVIQTLSGTSFDLRVSPYDTVMSVKARIQTHEGIPISQQHLVFRNCELKDDCCLSDYAIQDGSTLKLVLAMRGGPINTKRVSVDDETSSNSAYETAASAADFAEFIDPDYLAEQLSEGMTSGEKLNSASNQSNSKMALLVFRDGDQLSFFRLVDRGDGTLTPLSESAGANNLHSEYEDDAVPEEAVRRTVTATELPLGRRLPSEDESVSSESSESDLRVATRFSGNQTSLSLVRSGSIPPNMPSATRPSVCAYCSRFVAAGQPTAAAAVRNLMNGRGASVHHLPECPFRNSTEELRRFKENEDLRLTVRALRSKMAGMRLNRERKRALGGETSHSEPPKPLNSDRQKAAPTEPTKSSTISTTKPVATQEAQQKPSASDAAPKIAKSQTTTTTKTPSEPPKSDTLKNEASSGETNVPKSSARKASAESKDSLSSKLHFGVQVHSSPQSNSASPPKQVVASSQPPIKSQLTPLRTVEQHVDSSLAASANESAALEASRILSSLKRRHQVLEPIGVTRLRSGGVGVSHTQPVKAPAPSDDKAATFPPSGAQAARASVTRQRAPSGSHRLPPLETTAGKDESADRVPSANANTARTKNTAQPSQVANAAAKPSVNRNAATSSFGDANTIASLNASIKSTIAASIDMFSAFQHQQTAPLEKPPPPATNSKQRCALCGRKTGLVSYTCRCELNFCTLHRHAEAHNCTFDYKTEGRRALQQQNPLVAAPKLPKI